MNQFKKAFGLTLLAVFLMPFMAQAERYIVQFNNQAMFKTYSKAVKDHKSLINAYSNGPINSGVHFMNSNSAKVTDALDYVEMVIIDSDQQIDLSLLKNNPNIALIEKEQFYPAPRPMIGHLPFGGGFNAYAFDENDSLPWGVHAVNAPAAWELAGRGENARVMVLDTGVDKDHPAIAPNFVEGFDFTGSSEGIFDNIGHGTHVAGTILAAGGEAPLLGVAPGASLLAGKVCSDEGCSTLSIIAGVNWAVREKVDVVNMSLGGPFVSEAARKAYLAAEEADVLIVAASGNDGVGRVSYPAALPTTFAVGAVTPELVKADFSQWGPELDIVAPGVNVLSSVPQGTGQMSIAAVDLGEGLEDVKSAPLEGAAVTENPVSGEVVAAGLGKPEDFEGIDVRGKIALIERGEIPFGDKATAAAQAGAVGVLIYNNKEGLDRGTLNTTVSIPVLMIEQAIGQEMAQKSTTGSVEAVLGVVRSDYAELQGTSMATPHVAGVAALVRAANPGLTAAQVRELLRVTAGDLEDDNSENQLGSGLVDAEAAVRAAQEMNVMAIAN